MEDAFQKQQTSRMFRIVSALTFVIGMVATTTVDVTAESPLVGALKEPIERTGRYLGVGFGDGYFACEGSGAGVCRDLPPVSGRTLRRRQEANQWVGNTFYDKFDQSRDIHPSEYRVRRYRKPCGCDHPTTCDQCAAAGFGSRAEPYHESFPTDFDPTSPPSVLPTPVHPKNTKTTDTGSHADHPSAAAKDDDTDYDGEIIPLAPPATPPLKSSTPSPNKKQASQQQQHNVPETQADQSHSDRPSDVPSEDIPVGTPKSDVLPDVDELPELEELPEPVLSKRDTTQDQPEADNDLLTRRGWYIEAVEASRLARARASWSKMIASHQDTAQKSVTAPPTDAPTEAVADVETPALPAPTQEVAPVERPTAPAARVAELPRQITAPARRNGLKWKKIEGYGHPIRTNPFVR